MGEKADKSKKVLLKLECKHEFTATLLPLFAEKLINIEDDLKLESLLELFIKTLDEGFDNLEFNEIEKEEKTNVQEEK